MLKNMARRFLRRHPRARSLTYFIVSVPLVLSCTPKRILERYDTAFRLKLDPFGYRTDWGDLHLGLIEGLIRRAQDGNAPHALDLGCGEGWVSHRVSSLCADIVAVDVSPTGLARAVALCADTPNVAVRRWDLERDPLLGPFDLILAVCFLEVVLRPVSRRRVRRLVLEMLVPGGHLLVMTTKQSQVVEASAWCGVLAWGAAGVDRFLSSSGVLDRLVWEETDSHVVTLYRYRPAGVTAGA